MYTFSFGSHDLQISPHQIILISMSLVFYQFELKKKKKKSVLRYQEDCMVELIFFLVVFMLMQFLFDDIYRYRF